MPEIPTLAFPPRIINGELATVEQGSADDTVGQVHLMCVTPQGWLTSEPDFGLYAQQHLAGGADIDEIDRQITTYIPDADAALEGQLDLLNPALSIVGARIG